MVACVGNDIGKCNVFSAPVHDIGKYKIVKICNCCAHHCFGNAVIIQSHGSVKIIGHKITPSNIYTDSVRRVNNAARGLLQGATWDFKKKSLFLSNVSMDLKYFLVY